MGGKFLNIIYKCHLGKDEHILQFFAVGSRGLSEVDTDISKDSRYL